MRKIPDEHILSSNHVERLCCSLGLIIMQQRTLYERLMVILREASTWPYGLTLLVVRRIHVSIHPQTIFSKLFNAETL